MKRPGEITRPLVEQWLDDVVVVEENSVADAMVMLMERPSCSWKALVQSASPR